jgi:spermidine/putrescine transport system permease protein
MKASAIARSLKLSQGPANALPLVAFLIVGFAAPLLAVIAYSFMPARSFGLLEQPGFGNYVEIFGSNSYISFTWSMLYAGLTVLLLAPICYPIAYGMSRVFGRWAPVFTLLFTIPLFVSENVRLYGWVLFLIKNGVLLGTLKTLFGIDIDSWLYTRGVVLMGMVYVYLPFMLFPMLLGLANIPMDAREAALDLGASRWRLFRDIELPLAMPGIMIGALLCFVISLGAFSEAKFLGKGVIVTIAQDIESAFTFGQNWPRGSALSVLLILLAGSAVYLAIRRIRLDEMLGKR